MQTQLDAADLLVDLAQRDCVDPEDAARLLGLEIVAIDQVSIVRREYQLGSNELFADATAIVGGHDGSWRVIDLVPRELVLAPILERLPEAVVYEQRPILKHTNDGPMLIGMEHHFEVDAGTLVITTRDARIERVTISSDVSRE